MEWSQEGIVTGLRQQDPAAVRDWVTRYTPSIRRVGMSYLNNNDQATKLTKAVFSQALATIQTGFTPTDMEGWLVGMAKMRASQQVLATPAEPLPHQTVHTVPRPAPVSSYAPLHQDSAAYVLEAAAPLAEPLPAGKEMQPEPMPLVEPASAGKPGPSKDLDAQKVSSGWQGDWEDWQEVDLLEEEEERQHSGFFHALGVVAVAFLTLLVLGLLWMLAGQMMRLGAIPSYDLGYSWFNGHIYPFF